MTVSIGNMSPVWSNNQINYTAWGMNVNSTFFGANSYVVNLKINNTAIFSVNTAGHVYSNVYISRHYVTANIPSAVTVGAGARAFVVDSASATFGTSYTGGGSTKVPVWSDGANWKVG